MLKSDVLELEIEMTTMCNAHCPLCYRNYKSFPNCYKKLIIRPLDGIIQQLDEYVNLKFVMLVGSMSEPTLYPEFLNLVSYLKNRQIRIEICTNGDTQNDEFWADLGDRLNEDDMVYFTICGSTQEMHERYRVGTSLERILHNASVLRSHKPVDYAQCIRFSYNSNDFDSLSFKTLVSQFSHVYWTETFFPKSIDNYTQMSIDEYNAFFPADSKLKRYQLMKHMAEMKYSSNDKGHATCQSIEHHRQQIDVYGNIYPCYLYLESMNGQKWDDDYEKVVDLSNPCCKFCESHVCSLCRAYGLDYII